MIPYIGVGVNFPAPFPGARIPKRDPGAALRSGPAEAGTPYERFMGKTTTMNLEVNSGHEPGSAAILAAACPYLKAPEITMQHTGFRCCCRLEGRAPRVRFMEREHFQILDVNRGHEPSMGGRDSVEPASKRRGVVWGRDDIRARQSFALPAVRFMESETAICRLIAVPLWRLTVGCMTLLLRWFLG